MTSMQRALLLALALPMAACVQGYSSNGGPTGPSGCSSDVVPALAIAVRDSVTQKGIASGTHVSGIVRGQHGTFDLSQPISSDSLTIWLGTISGTYDLAFSKAGYQDVSKTGIVVQPADSLDCHPKTVTIDVLLQPAS